MKTRVLSRGIPVTFEVDVTKFKDYIILYDRDEFKSEEPLFNASIIHSQQELCSVEVFMKRNGESVGRILGFKENPVLGRKASVIIAKTDDLEWLSRTFNLMQGRRDGETERKPMGEVSLDLIA